MQIAKRFSGVIIPASLQLKQEAIPDRFLQVTQRDGTIFLVVTALIALSGLPALFVAQLWSNLGIQSILHFPTVTFWSVFKIMYCAGIACVLPMLAILLSFKVLSLNLSRLTAILSVTESGIGWTSANFLTRLTLKWLRQAPAPVKWKDVIAVTLGETASTLAGEYKIEVSRESYKGEFDYSNKPVGRANIINFVGKGADGKLKPLLTVSLNALSKESKRDLALAIEKYARHAVITRKALEEFIGAEVEESRSLSYTAIWLNVLNSTESRIRCEDLAPGDQLRNSDFTIVKRLARGGHANLYLAEMATGRFVVLKEFITTTVDARSAMVGLEEFETESSMLERISHSNICGLVEVFSEDSRVYIALDYVEARSLRDVVEDEGPLDPDRVLEIGRQTAHALSYLHSLSPPIIHRDVSPDNILLCDDGTVKVIDFSVAANGVSEKISGVVGKPSFVSPDQFRGRVRLNNDVYGFGATLYYALVGKDPEPITQLSAAPAVTSDGSDLSKLVYDCTAIDRAKQAFESMEQVKTSWF